MTQDFANMTDAQAVRFMLMLPWTLGDTDHGRAAYDAGEIESVLGFVDKIDARATSAEEDRDQWKLLYQDSLAREMRLLGRIELVDAYIERIRVALGGYADSDLRSLALTLRKRNDTLEAEVDWLREVRTAGCRCSDTDACRFVAERDAALADAAKCRAERARYGDRMTSMLASAEANIERIRIALGGYTDSDLASLAETLAARNDALEAEVERLRDELARSAAHLALY